MATQDQAICNAKLTEVDMFDLRFKEQNLPCHLLAKGIYDLL